MTVRELHRRLVAAGVRVEVDGPMLRLFGDVPPDLGGWAVCLHVGLRCLVSGCTWYGITREGHSPEPGTGGVLSLDRPLPPNTYKTIAAGDPSTCWDRPRWPEESAARAEVPDRVAMVERPARGSNVAA